MTVTPTAATPAILPGVGPAGADGGTTGTGAAVPGDFLALVQQALVAALGGTLPGTPAANAGPAGPKKPATPTPGTGDGKAGAAPGGASGPDATSTAAATGLVAVVPTLPLPGVVVAPTADTGVAAAPAAAGSSTVGRATPSAPTAADGRTAPPTTGAAPSTTEPPPLAAAGRPGHADSGPSADPGTGQQAPAAPAAPTAVPSSSTVTAVATPTPALALHATAAAAAPAPVTGQVFPEVTSLVSRGDGTHRITLTLKPEALGEVRVVMTVRDGAVHVRLAAGHEAQQALLAGSSELSRLLEHAGATDTRIVVRDLMGAAAATTGSSNDRGADLGQAPGFGPGAGDNRSQDQHAGTRAGDDTQHQATDGTHDTTTAGTGSSRPVQPATRTRTAGVDVTM